MMRLVLAAAVVLWSSLASAQYTAPLDYNVFPPLHASNALLELECYAGTAPTTGPGFLNGVSGTGAVMQSPVTNSVLGVSYGSCRFNLGTTTTGRAGLITGWSASVAGNPGSIDFANGTTKFFALFDELTASTAGETYTAFVGFGDSLTTTPIDGCFFRYTHGTNSGKWQIVARSNDVETATALDSGITFTAATRRQFGVVATSTSCAFYSNGVQVTNSPISTNIPSGGTRTTAALMNFIKSAGTTETVPVALDYMAVLGIPTTPRGLVPF